MIAVVSTGVPKGHEQSAAAVKAQLGPWDTVSIIVGIVAVILGFIARSQGSRSGMGLAGLILGFATILLGVLATVLLIIGIAWMQANQGQFGPGGPGGGAPGGGQRKNF